MIFDKYVGDTCTGCGKFKKYVNFIVFIKKEDICKSCYSIIPEYIPKNQHKKYLCKKYGI